MPPRKKATTKATKKSGPAKPKRKVSSKKDVSLRKVKKILDSKSKASSVVMFEQEKEVKINARNISPINISVAQHPLDQYSSPHLLDLSGKRHIERVKPLIDNSAALRYSDLPAGDVLEKLQVFELLAIENSEILNFIRVSWLNLFRPFRKVDLSPKLPLTSKKQSKIDSLGILHEVSVINLIVFIVSEIGLFASSINQLIQHTYTSLAGQYLAKDEVMGFKSKEIPYQEIVSADYGVIATKDLVMPSPKTSWEMPRLKIPRLSLRLKLPSIHFTRLLRLGEFFSSFERVSMPIKPLATFIVAALLVVVPIELYYYAQSASEVKGKVLGQAEQALSGLSQAKDALADFNLSSAESYLISANQDFVSAQNQLNEIKSVLTVLAETLPLNNTYRSGKNLLDLGEKLTKSGEYLISGLSQLSGDSELSLVSRAKNFRADIKLAIAELEASQENLDKIKLSHLPDENQDTFVKLKNNLPVFINSLKKSDEMVDFAINFLGDNDLKKYLIVFQNDNELRATGGFMGSFALVDFKGGDIDNIKMPGGGAYDVRAGFKKLLAAPEPMRLINPRWEFQDANWWPDFPTSAENIAYFYNKSDGATVDGVIVINSDWLGGLLSVIGDIDMPDYDKVITAANFENELQKAVEIEYEDKKQPKKILGDLAPKIIEKVFDAEPSTIMGLVSVLSDGLKSKDLMVHLFDQPSQEFVENNNWDGRMKDSGSDYLSVVATNIGGGKTDNIIDQNIYHKAEILSDGSVIDSVLINRTHFGPTDNEFTNRFNRSYLRVYVPLGSQLISASGFIRPLAEEFKELEDYLEEDIRLDNEKQATTDRESLTRIYTENGKTVYGNWLSIEPGESQEVLLVYKLPFKVEVSQPEVVKTGLINKIKAVFAPRVAYDSYSLLVQKQSGSGDDVFSSTVEYPDNINSYITYPNEVTSTRSGVQYQHSLSEDLFYFVGLKKHITN
jgi:hypothetical protein